MFFRTLKRTFAVFAVGVLMSTGASSAAGKKAYFADGTIITMKSDIGHYAGRCRGCLQNATEPDSIANHIKNAASDLVKFRVQNQQGGKISLQADDGTYLKRCRGCVPNSKYSDFLMASQVDPTKAIAQFTVTKHPNGKFSFQADTGSYIARCNPCAKNESYPNNLVIDAKSFGNPQAQWEVAIVNQIKIGPKVPNDIARKAPSNAYLVELAQFAWQQFVSLGWESTYDPANNNFKRGVADKNWNGAGSPKHAVWETFAHRSELRPFGQPLTANFSSQPDYITQISKLGKLKQGTNQAGNLASFTLLNNLDEDNEIGSASVYLGPKIDPKTSPLILYQAKVSEDEFNYVKDVFGDEQHLNPGTLSKAAARNAANIKEIKAYFADKQTGKPDYDTCNPPAGYDKNSFITLPCGQMNGQLGSVEIKTAYYKIPKGQVSKYKDFFVRDAIYYTKDNNGVFTYHNAKFALLGIHIIHKTENFPGFIFTTFEHNSLSSMDFQYRLLAPLPPLYGPFNPHNAPKAKAGEQTGNLIKIVRQTGTSPTSNGTLYPIPTQFSSVNGAAQTQLTAIGSIWSNYQLAGVQALPTNSYSSAMGPLTGPNHFMANHVIESDAFLGNFFGPGFSSNDPAFPTGLKYPDGTRNGDNFLYEGQTFNMGGCKGCHGVAQTAFGTDSSFLLDFAGKPVVEPDPIFFD